MANSSSYLLYKSYNFNAVRRFSYCGGNIENNIKAMLFSRNFRLMVVTPCGAFIIKAKFEKPIKVSRDILYPLDQKKINNIINTFNQNTIA